MERTTFLCLAAGFGTRRESPRNSERNDKLIETKGEGHFPHSTLFFLPFRFAPNNVMAVSTRGRRRRTANEKGKEEEEEKERRIKLASFSDRLPIRRKRERGTDKGGKGEENYDIACFPLISSAMTMRKNNPLSTKKSFFKLQVVYLGDTGRLFTTGFSKFSDRQVGKFANLLTISQIKFKLI